MDKWMRERSFVLVQRNPGSDCAEDHKKARIGLDR